MLLLTQGPRRTALGLFHHRALNDGLARQTPGTGGVAAGAEGIFPPIANSNFFARKLSGGVTTTILDTWFTKQGFAPFPFQRQVWDAVANQESGLLHATTGAGKTYAVWLGALAVWGSQRSSAKPASAAPPLTVLWLTPMRALAADTTRALERAAADLAPTWTIGVRTGDTSASARAAQKRRLPTALVTTPESLSLQLSRPEAATLFQHLQMVVVDEWHELLGNKRGVQVQLALARLRRWRPALAVWGLSATLGDIEHARAVLLGTAPGRIVKGDIPRDLAIDTLLPPTSERFPWAGHLGLRLLPQVIDEIDKSGSTLVFTNTRSQAELWYQAILAARPDWAGLIALHHGSLDRKVRGWVEAGLVAGSLRAVVCTSSLDLGVDFPPVERVLQIGSAKGVARLLQRAGRSGHAPGRGSRLTLVPTHALELVEAAAARAAADAGQVEARHSPAKPLDVLVQHVVTIALGGGFHPEELLAEVRTAWAYRELTDGEWRWALLFVRQGGEALAAYPDYQRVAPDEEGVWRVPDRRVARRHRLGIGTIVADASVTVKFWGRGAGGATLGSVEEAFIARLRPGDCFLFSGRLLELVRVEGMVAYVRRATGKKPAVPRWNGGRMPLSSELSEAVLEQLEAASAGDYATPELQAARPLLAVQLDWSSVPTRDLLLAETLVSREGCHLFLYPFAGRQAHLGLASLLAWRLGQRQPLTFSIAVNDYGLELLSATPVPWQDLVTSQLLSDDGLLEDVLASLNAAELAQRRFREIARIAGLLVQGYPGQPRSNKQLQASAGLFFQVFRQYDPDNLLLAQAMQEVLRQELDVERLEHTLRTMRARRMQWQPLKRATPFGFPLMVERFRERLTSERLSDRIARLLGELEAAAGPSELPLPDRIEPSALPPPDEKPMRRRRGRRGF